MLVPLAADVPDGYQARLAAQIIDVPVGRCCPARMLRDSGTEPTGPERGADVQVVARLEPQ